MPQSAVLPRPLPAAQVKKEEGKKAPAAAEKDKDKAGAAGKAGQQADGEAKPADGGGDKK